MGKLVTTDVLGKTASFLQLAGLWLRIILRRISSVLFFFFFAACSPTVQLKPKPAPLGLCVARIGSVIPRPSGPRPIPGLQPMLCNMRLPMFVSGMGGAFSPTTPGGTTVPRGAAFRLLLMSPVHREPRCPLVCLLAVFTEQLLRCPLSVRGSQCSCPWSLLELELNQGSWGSWLSLSLKP